MILPSGKQFAIITVASILLGHFFITIGRDETIVDFLSQSWYYSDLFFVSIISFCIVTYVAVIHYSLDAKIPVRTNFVRRVALQSVLGVAAPSVLALALTFIYMEFILKQNISETTFFIYEFPISIVVIFTINLLFMISTLISFKESRTTLLVTQAGRRIPLQIAAVAGIAKEGDYVLIHTFDQQQYVSSETLEELETSLPPNTFFRANRQWIVHRTTCGSFNTERSGKVNLTLKEPVGKEITVSQKRAQEFKAWLASN